MPAVCWQAFDVFIQKLSVLHLEKQFAIFFHVGRVHQDDLVDDFERALPIAGLHERFTQYIQQRDGFISAAGVVKLNGERAFE